MFKAELLALYELQHSHTSWFSPGSRLKLTAFLSGRVPAHWKDLPGELNKQNLFLSFKFLLKPHFYEWAFMKIPIPCRSGAWNN